MPIIGAACPTGVSKDLHRDQQRNNSEQNEVVTLGTVSGKSERSDGVIKPVTAKVAGVKSSQVTRPLKQLQSGVEHQLSNCSKRKHQLESVSGKPGRSNSVDKSVTPKVAGVNSSKENRTVSKITKPLKKLQSVVEHQPSNSCKTKHYGELEGITGKQARSEIQPHSSLEPAVMSSEVLQRCNDVLQMIFYQKSSYDWPLYTPEHLVLLKLHDYHQIVEKSMFLETIFKKLMNEEYKTKEDFANDVRLSFTSCYKYYSDKHCEAVCKARILQDFFEKMYAKIPDDDGADENMKPFSEDDKLKLICDMDELSQSEQGPVVDIIMAREPSQRDAVLRGLEVHLNPMKSSTLRELQVCVEGLLKKRRGDSEPQRSPPKKKKRMSSS